MLPNMRVKLAESAEYVRNNPKLPIRTGIPDRIPPLPTDFYDLLPSRTRRKTKLG